MAEKRKAEEQPGPENPAKRQYTGITVVSDSDSEVVDDYEGIETADDSDEDDPPPTPAGKEESSSDEDDTPTPAGEEEKDASASEDEDQPSASEDQDQPSASEAEEEYEKEEDEGEEGEGEASQSACASEADDQSLQDGEKSQADAEAKTPNSGLSYDGHVSVDGVMIKITPAHGKAVYELSQAFIAIQREAVPMLKHRRDLLNHRRHRAKPERGRIATLFRRVTDKTASLKIRSDIVAAFTPGSDYSSTYVEVATFADMPAGMAPIVETMLAHLGKKNPRGYTQFDGCVGFKFKRRKYERRKGASVTACVCRYTLTGNRKVTIQLTRRSKDKFTTYRLDHPKYLSKSK